MSLDEQKNNQPETPEEDNPLSSFEQVNDTSEQKKAGKLESFLVTGKGIAMTLISTLVLVGAIILLLIWNPFATQEETPEQPDTPSTEETTTITVLDKSKENEVVIQRVDITNKDDNFTILYNKNEKVFYLDGYTDILLSTDMTDLLQEYTAKLVAVDTVSKVTELKDFGLDKPTATIAITYTDGSKATMYVGNVTPTEDGYYVRTDKDDKVYIFETEAVLPFTYRHTAFADITLISSPSVKSDDENGSAVLKEISYKGKNYDQPLVMRRSYLADGDEMALFSYIIEKPYVRGTSDETSGILSAFKSLYAEQALILHPTAKEKTSLGFDDPLAVITATMAVETTSEAEEEGQEAESLYYNSITSTITIGSMDKDSYVVMVNGIDAIFLVSHSTFSDIADRTYKNSVNKLLFLKNITDIGRVSVTIDGKTSDFVLSHYPNKEDNDAKLKVTVNDKVYDSADFRELYQILMSMERYGDTDAVPKDEAVMTLKVYLNDGTLYMGARYSSLDGNLCYVETTEGEVFTTRWSIVSHFVEQVQNYLNGEKVILLT